MQGYPPPVLVEAWLFLATHHSPELEHVKLSLRRAIKYIFGSNELAQLYIEQNKDKQIGIHFA